MIGKPVHVFALPATQPPVAKPSIAKPTPLTVILQDGRQVAIPPLATRLPFLWRDYQAITSSPPRAAAPHAQAPARPTPAPAQPAAAAEGPNIVSRSKDAWAWFSGTRMLVSVPQGATHKQIVDVMQTVMPVNQADSFADTALHLVHSQSGHAVLMGVTVGGIAAAILAFLGYERKIVIGGGTTVALVAIGAFLFYGHQENPFVGKWTLNALESHYESGTPPREASDEIAVEGDALKVVHLGILNDGTRDDRTYRIDGNGKWQTAIPAYPRPESSLRIKNE